MWNEYMWCPQKRSFAQMPSPIYISNEIKSKGQNFTRILIDIVP